MLCWKGHSSLLPLDTNIWGPSLPEGIKWADKLLTYQFKPNLWEWKAAWEPNELALNIQISWELTRSGSQQAYSSRGIVRRPFIWEAKKITKPQRPLREAIKRHLIRNTFPTLLCRWRIPKTGFCFSFSSFRKTDKLHIFSYTPYNFTWNDATHC